MKILITGTPGVGKTVLAKKLGKKFSYPVINEKDFSLKNNIGSFNEENELEIPLKLFEKKMNLYLKKTKNVIIEGHVLCEMKLDVDLVILIKINPEELQMRLSKRNYSEIKIMDNAFCEGIDYCKKKVLKNYKKIVIINSKNSEKETFMSVMNVLNP